MRNFLLATLIFFLGNVCLVNAKDTNDLGQYDKQLVADVLSASDDKIYPILKLFYPSWVKLDQEGQKIQSSQRIIAIYNELLTLSKVLETSYAGIVNDLSCGEEGSVTLYSWQVRNFGGLPGYCYFLPEKGKLKVERVVLQPDGTGWVKNITCARDVAGLSDATAGQEQYVLEVLSTYFPEFKWGNLIWNPDSKISFAVEVLSLPEKYLSPPAK